MLGTAVITLCSNNAADDNTISIHKDLHKRKKVNAANGTKTWWNTNTVHLKARLTCTHLFIHFYLHDATRKRGTFYGNVAGCLSHTPVLCLNG